MTRSKDQDKINIYFNQKHQDGLKINRRLILRIIHMWINTSKVLESPVQRLGTSVRHVNLVITILNIIFILSYVDLY